MVQRPAARAGVTTVALMPPVLARRGFMRFLYVEVLQLLGGREATLLAADGHGKFAVPDDCTFHLYVSTAPCGTASCTRGGGKASKVPETARADGEGAPPPAPQSSGEAAPAWFIKGSGDPEAPPGCCTAEARV
eukprot:s21_g10.t1